MLSDANYILGQDADTQVAVGMFLEILLAIANIATAVVLFPILRRQSEAISLGYVAFGSLNPRSSSSASSASRCRHQ